MQPIYITGEKAHQCEECGKCFRRHDHLTVHYKSVHLGEKVWQKYVFKKKLVYFPFLLVVVGTFRKGNVSLIGLF